ncbi:MAG: ATP-binding cassette domain-containing protein [Candidatus Hydrothermarchaeota archaeon]
MHAIVVEEITKEFNGLVAVNKVNLKVKRGELLGLLGPNGAGKTTLIHMLCTLIPPTHGRGEVWGYDIVEEPDEVRKSIGIVFQDPTLDEKLTARENLDFHGRMYGMQKAVREKRLREVLELVELTDRENSLVETFSGGMMRRLEIARGLMHKPKVLFLDEPTLGLDPQTRRHIWNYIKELNKREDITIVLTTHYMEEADFLCDRVAIIDQGKIISLDSPESLKKNLGGDIIYLKVSNAQKMAEIFSRLDFVQGVKIVDETIQLKVSDGEKTIPKVLDIARENGTTVEAVSATRPTLEDVFIQYTGRRIREQEVSSREKTRAMIRAIRRRR